MVPNLDRPILILVTKITVFGFDFELDIQQFDTTSTWYTRLFDVTSLKYSITKNVSSLFLF